MGQTVSLFRAGLSDRFLPHKGSDLPEFPPDRPAPKEIDLHYYNFNIGDYRRDTGHLSLLEHGVYRQLIDTYYLSEKPISKDIANVMRTHCVRSAEEKQALEYILKDFFDERDDGFHHIGCEKVLEQYRAKSDKARASAMARWSQSDANALPTDSERNAIGMLTNNQEPITNNQEPVVIKEPKGSLSEASLPPCQHQKVIDLFHEVLPELPRVLIWNKTREGLLKARWRERAAQDKWKTAEEGLEFFRSYFEYVRKSKFLMGKVSGSGKRPFECELEWLVRPNNWVKVLEGKYHGA